MGVVLEGALSIHGCMDASGLPPVYAALAVTPKGGGDCVVGSISDPRKARRRPFRSSTSPPQKTHSWRADTTPRTRATWRAGSPYPKSR